MSVLEMVRTKVKELTDPNGPANGLLQSAKSAVSHGLDGASKFVDEKTNGKYTSQINTGVHKAKEFLGEDKGEGQAQGEDRGEGHDGQKPADAASAEAKPAGTTSAEGSAEAKPAEAQSPETPQPQTPKPPESNEPPQA